MERTPSFLAALASAAVPGLDPVSVEALPSLPEQSFDVAFVQDDEHRRWVVRAPRSDVAGAEMERTVPLLSMLGRRLPFAVPAPKGFAPLADGGRAVVYPYLPGHNLDYPELPPGPGLAAELGRSIAALHNTEPGVFEEAGMPSYDADSYRGRRLAELDRAAETGRVPTALLTRWEGALEDVSLWRFAPTATHGDLTGDQVLAVFTDDSDASTGRIRAMTGWEDAKVADPADDFAALVADAPAATVETVFEAYAHARVERPDANLLVRARLVAELGLLGSLMSAVAHKDVGGVEVLTTQLRRLDDAVHAERSPGDDDYRRTSLAPVQARARPAPPPALVVDDDEDDLPQVDTPRDDDSPDPTDPTHPTDPTDRAERTETDQLVDSGTPTDRAERTETDQLVDSGTPTYRAERTETDQLVDSGTPTDPTDRAERTETDQLVNSGTPTDPTDFPDPTDPTDPAERAQLDQLVDSGTPTDPADSDEGDDRGGPGVSAGGQRPAPG